MQPRWSSSVRRPLVLQLARDTALSASTPQYAYTAMWYGKPGSTKEVEVEDSHCERKKTRKLVNEAGSGERAARDAPTGGAARRRRGLRG